MDQKLTLAFGSLSHGSAYLSNGSSSSFKISCMSLDSSSSLPLVDDYSNGIGRSSSSLVNAFSCMLSKAS